VIPEFLEPWVALLLSAALLALVHRLLTRLLLRLFYRLTNNLTLSLLIYALLIWPGTVLHELSHFIVARLLGVRAGLPHLLPGRPDKQGRMVLGYVLVERSDPVRRALIGAAPLVAGSVAIALLAHHAFVLPAPIAQAGLVQTVRELVASLPRMANVPDAWLYFYILFAIANGMMPSASDREAWPALLLFSLMTGLLIFLTTGIPQVPTPLSRLGLQAVTWLTFSFVMTILLNLALFLFLAPLEVLFRRARQ
jgi:hypothetical protein